MYINLYMTLYYMYMHGSVVKLGSPNLNLLIIAGASLLYLAMFFYSMSMHNLSQQLEETLLCNVSHVDCVYSAMHSSILMH